MKRQETNTIQYIIKGCLYFNCHDALDRSKSINAQENRRGPPGYLLDLFQRAIYVSRDFEGKQTMLTFIKNEIGNKERKLFIRETDQLVQILAKQQKKESSVGIQHLLKAIGDQLTKRIQCQTPILKKNNKKRTTKFEGSRRFWTVCQERFANADDDDDLYLRHQLEQRMKERDDSNKIWRRKRQSELELELELE